MPQETPHGLALSLVLDLRPVGTTAYRHHHWGCLHCNQGTA